MIDIENEVFTRLAKPLRGRYPGIFVSGEYVRAPAAFPHVSIVQSDSYAPVERGDTGITEKYSAVTFDVDVYSNLQTGKKSQCKAIMITIDALLYAMNFRRLVLTPVPNLEDATIYRLTAQYTAETDGTYFYRR
mgnify:FL=1